MSVQQVGGRRIVGVMRRVERPEAVLLALALAVLAALGWVATPFWLAIVVGLQLVVAGVGTVLLLGPVRPQYGFARYATPAVAAVALTLAGRLLGGFVQLAAAPVAALLLLGVTWAEMRLPERRTPRLALELMLVGICFAAAVGIGAVFPRTAWPPTVVLLVAVLAIPTLRSAELRGRYGLQAVGQAMLHLLAIAQLGVALALLDLPGVVGSAILALGFHAWAGAADALDAGASGRSVVIEFGTLALLGLAVALLLYGR